MSKILVIISVLVLFGTGLFAYSSNQKKQCEEKATVASVETYQMSRYPDTNERARLQQNFEQRYILANCN